MHEMSIVQSILEVVNDEAQRNGLSRVVSVKLKLGEMSGAAPASLLFCWELIVGDGPAAGARLEIEPVLLKARCRKCQAEFSPHDYVFICPACGSNRVEVAQGQEITVSSIEGD